MSEAEIVGISASLIFKILTIFKNEFNFTHHS